MTSRGKLLHLERLMDVTSEIGPGQCFRRRGFSHNDNIASCSQSNTGVTGNAVYGNGIVAIARLKTGISFHLLDMHTVTAIAKPYHGVSKQR